MEALTGFTPEVVKRLILQVSFFNDFSDAEKDYVLKYMVAFLRFKPQEVIISADSLDDQAMYVLLSGRALIASGQNNAILDEVPIGDFFGEVSFLTGRPRTASVIAEEACILWRIDHELLRDAPIALREKIKDKIIAKLVRVIIHSNQQLSNVFV